ncbi:MAG: discoidin domain-containing protein [Prevotellaceae bacterium]|jgi:hypothetical protein|nr:discoidin domain-containing protein [Prevotellaceae bacterium]
MKKFSIFNVQPHGCAALTCLLLLGTLLCFSGCRDQDDFSITIDTVEDGMHLAVNAEEIVLSQDLLDDPAVTFTWGEAQPRANNGVITYYFKLGLPGFTKAIEKIEMAPGVFTYSLSHWNLYTLLHNELEIPLGSGAQLEAEVIASSDEGEFFVKPEISTATFNVVTFEIVPTPLYLVGSANPDGEANGIKLTELTGEGKDFGNRYEWVGELQAGTFLFVNSLTGDEGSWSKGASEQDLVENSAGSAAGQGFTVERPGLYSILIDKRAGEIIHGYKGFGGIWAFGSGLTGSWNWNFSEAPLFSWDPRSPHLFTLACTIPDASVTDREFKLLCVYHDEDNPADWGDILYLLHSEVNGVNIWDDNRVRVMWHGEEGSKGDTKWITDPAVGPCTVTVDAYNMAIYLSPQTGEQYIAKHNWTIHSSYGDWNDGLTARNTIDGNPMSCWHTNPGINDYPYWFIVDFQKELTVNGILFLNRQDDLGATNFPKHVKWETSNDPAAGWTTVLELDALPNVRTRQTLPCTNVTTARYLRFSVYNGWDGDNYTFVGEMSIY